MDFRLTVPISPAPFRIEPTHHGMVLGSCFATHIGGWLAEGKMPVCVNPFGVLYNPVSIAQAWERLETAEPFTRADLFEHNGLWHSFAHHGDFSGPDPEAVLERMNRTLQAAHDALQRADYLIVTLGTSWVYEHEGRVVANCHKLPSRQFTRRRLTVDESSEALEGLAARRPELTLLVTVSPVIHRGDGLIENQWSKATLVLAAHRLEERLPEQVRYFPTYEIVTGELRDYRFYADDMCHPSAVAIDYVRERFAEGWLSAASRELLADVGALRQAMHHRPLHPDSPEYALFRVRMRQKVERLQQRYKSVDFGAELQFFG